MAKSAVNSNKLLVLKHRLLTHSTQKFWINWNYIQSWNFLSFFWRFVCAIFYFHLESQILYIKKKKTSNDIIIPFFNVSLYFIFWKNWKFSCSKLKVHIKKNYNLFISLSKHTQLWCKAYCSEGDALGRL